MKLSIQMNSGNARRRRCSVLFLAISFGLAIVTCLPIEADDYAWQRPHTKVHDNGDLEWAPEPFAYEPRGEIRYIDFENGVDTQSGATPEQAWKHHPWDPAASGQAKAGRADTYVFKGGVVYRGTLRVPADVANAGKEPLQLTRDPGWGSGEAVISGSERVTAWVKGAGHKDIPERAKVWTARLDFAPRSLWMLGNDGAVTRIALARTPNWKVSDPYDVMNEWWEWENPEWWKHMRIPDKRAKVKNKKWGVVGIDRKHLTEDPSYYVGAVVRTEWGNLMSMPAPCLVEHFDPATRTLSFNTPFLPFGHIKTGHRYFLEDKPQYLDEAGEFWFEKRGAGGILHVRLPGDIDPRSVRVEAARHCNLIDAASIAKLSVSGLTFRFTNHPWRYYDFFFSDEDLQGAAVRILGSATDVRVANCRFEHVNKAVRITARKRKQIIERVSITDNEIRHTDHGAIHVLALGPRQSADPGAFPHLRSVDVLRNNLYEIGLRMTHMGHQHAIMLHYPEQAHVAGNILYRIYQGGMEINGDKGGGQPTDAPLARIIVHHNKVTDDLLSSCDWGSIRMNQGGPTYIYNNVVRNPRGFANYKHRQKKQTGAPSFGFCYYVDGGYQKFLFNNIAWGRNNDLGSKYANMSAFQTLWSFQNMIFNNTAYRFVAASRNQNPALGRWAYLGNVFQDVSQYVFRHGNPAQGEADLNAADAAGAIEGFDYSTFAYANNVFYDIRGAYGVFEANGTVHTTLDKMQDAMAKHGLISDDVGVEAVKAPLRDPAEFDMRPVPGSGVENRGAKVFMPWGLYAVVGEWQFYRNAAQPTRITDYHWYMQEPYDDRQHYIDMPRYPLQADWARAEDYVPGCLEDWIPGALQFSGKPAIVSAEALAKGVDYKAEKGRRVQISGDEFRTADMDTSNLLVEVVFQAEPRRADAALVRKLSEQAGYSLNLDGHGVPVLKLRSGAVARAVKGTASLADGQWHHLIAEVDRKQMTVRLYVDGQIAGEGEGIGNDRSLSNDAALEIGAGFHGLLDFVRIARGTLADARTDIAELHEWQFNGPQFRDFTGRKSKIGKRAAGAIDLE